MHLDIDHLSTGRKCVYQFSLLLEDNKFFFSRVFLLWHPVVQNHEVFCWVHAFVGWHLQLEIALNQTHFTVIGGYWKSVASFLCPHRPRFEN